MISAATIGNAAEDGSAGSNPGAVQFGLSGKRYPAAVAASFLRNNVGAKMPQHQLCVVAAGLALDDRGDPGAASPARSTADLICAEATGVR